MHTTPLPTFAIENSLYEKGYSYIAGVDEAGRGPLAGPIVAAAVIFYKTPPPDIPEGFVKDSKKIAEKKREKAAKMIKKEACAIGVEVVSSAYIDNKGIAKANRRAFRGAVKKLRGSVDYVLLDGNKETEFDSPATTIVKGDSLSFSIAAASIIAKVHRDAIMQKLSKEFPHYGFEKNKGYGTREHMEAIRKYGPSKHHRVSFLRNIL